MMQKNIYIMTLLLRNSIIKKNQHHDYFALSQYKTKKKYIN